MGCSARSWVLPRRTQRIEKKIAGLTALIGVLFAFPAHGALLYDNTAASNISSWGYNFQLEPNPGDECYAENWTVFEFTPTQTFSIEKVEMAMFATWGSVADITIQNHLGQWKVLTTQTVDQSYATLESGTSSAPYLIAYKDQPTSIYIQPFPIFAATGSLAVNTGNESGTLIPDDDSRTYAYTQTLCAGTSPILDSAGSFKMKIWGTLIDEQSVVPPGTDTPIPTSTYDNTFADAIPDLSWGSSTNALTTSTFYGTKINNMFGSATNTFPLCMVPPWFALLDSLSGATATNTPQTLVLGGAGIVPTTTFSLEQMPTVLANVGAKTAIETFTTFIKGLLWLAFGLYVFMDIFKPKAKNDTL